MENQTKSNPDPEPLTEEQTIRLLRCRIAVQRKTIRARDAEIERLRKERNEFERLLRTAEKYTQHHNTCPVYFNPPGFCRCGKAKWLEDFDGALCND